MKLKKFVTAIKTRDDVWRLDTVLINLDRVIKITDVTAEITDMCTIVMDTGESIVVVGSLKEILTEDANILVKEGDMVKGLYSCGYEVKETTEQNVSNSI